MNEELKGRTIKSLENAIENSIELSNHCELRISELYRNEITEAQEIIGLIENIEVEK